MEWSYEGLWPKTKIYVARAHECQRNDPLFPFWSSLALELLGRATLAKVHPALLADIKNGGDNLLHAFGVVKLGSPRSIPAHTVFERCKQLVPKFTRDECSFCVATMERRNEELHTGSPVFYSLSTDEWQATYYRVCQILLEHLGLTLADLLGPEEGEIAERMIEEATKEVASGVKEAVSRAKNEFLKLDAETQTERKERGAEHVAHAKGPFDDTRTCPACAGMALMEGERVSALEPRLEGDDVVQAVNMLPTRLLCPCCGLSLQGHVRLQAVQRGGQYTVELIVNSSEYYTDALGPDGDYEEYGND